ncbi:uncharacterized protein LOC132548076 [Ylistrum balloti]|uniref:uncharacterized protein LOC132548076 n=1 Tax=Ylistrum balloti TaxID=509963 RepID=UPI0029058A34|nr:uncharacterized protein LOC132548076 [Ylistrum balloti]
MNNTSSETSTTPGVAPNDVTSAGLANNGGNSGSSGNSELVVGLSIGGVLLAAILVFFVAYCVFSRRKNIEADNINVQRISMNSENFSHVTNLKKLEPLENRNGKAIPKRTKPTLDEKREAGKTDDLSDVDLSLFSGEGQLNPAFVDDEEVHHSHQDDRKTSDTEKDDNVVIFKLEGVVKFDMSQMVGFDKNLALSLESQTSADLQKIVTTNGDVNKYTALDKDDSVRNGISEEKIVTTNVDDINNTQNKSSRDTKKEDVDYKTNPSKDSKDSSVPTRTVNYETVESVDREYLSKMPQHRSDTVDDVRPGTSKGNMSTIISFDEDSIQVISEDPPSSSKDKQAGKRKDSPTSSKVLTIPTQMSEVVSTANESDKTNRSQVKDSSHSFVKETSQDRSVSVIEKSIDLEDEEYKRRHSVRGKEVTTIFIGENTKTGDKRRGRHDKIVFKSNPKSDNSSGKGDHRKRHLENDPPLKAKDMNVPVKIDPRETGRVKKFRHDSSDKPVEHSSRSVPITKSKNNDIGKGKTVPTKPPLSREASTYEIPWDLTDVGALLMQINDIAESKEVRVDTVSGGVVFNSH